MKSPSVRERRREEILRAAIKVFARKGFAGCRVSDIAAEAGVGYGLIYHYFSSKEEVLGVIFRERWEALLAKIEAVDRQPLDPRAKLEEIAAFIFESYAREPELMKVIVVEVTRSANDFGRRHLAEIAKAQAGVAAILEQARREGILADAFPTKLLANCFLGVIEQLLSGWLFGLLDPYPATPRQLAALIGALLCEGACAKQLLPSRPLEA